MSTGMLDNRHPLVYPDLLWLKPEGLEIGYRLFQLDHGIIEHGVCVKETAIFGRDNQRRLQGVI